MNFHEGAVGDDSPFVFVQPVIMGVDPYESMGCLDVGAIHESPVEPCRAGRS